MAEKNAKRPGAGEIAYQARRKALHTEEKNARLRAERILRAKIKKSQRATTNRGSARAARRLLDGSTRTEHVLSVRDRYDLKRWSETGLSQ